MALLPVNPETLRIALPEEDSWAEVRKAYSMGDMERMRHEQSAFGLVEVGLIAWSYDEPVTPETIRRLDVPTFNLILDAVSAQIAPVDRESKNS